MFPLFSHLLLANTFPANKAGRRQRLWPLHACQIQREEDRTQRTPCRGIRIVKMMTERIATLGKTEAQTYQPDGPQECALVRQIYPNRWAYGQRSAHC